MKRSITRMAAALALASAPTVLAAPFYITFTDTTDAGSNVPGIVDNSGASVTVVIDNGGATAANQTWQGSDLQCVIHRFNNGSAYIAFSTPAGSLDDSVGSITTNGSGVLTGVMSSWYENGGVPAARIATNIKSSPFDRWYVNAANGTLYWADGRSIGLTNVDDEDQPSSWSNPQDATGVCASYNYGTATDLAPLEPVTGVPVPALDAGPLAAMAAMLGLMGLWMRRRQRN